MSKLKSGDPVQTGTSNTVQYNGLLFPLLRLNIGQTSLLMKDPTSLKHV